MKLLLLAPLVIAATAPAQPALPVFSLAPIAAPAQPDAIPLPVPDPVAAGREQWGMLNGRFADGTTMAARIVRNVSRPTITPVLPDPANATGAAVIVAPGGAFLSLSMDSEGYAVARWLADHGIAAFVLKYRLNPTPFDDAAFMGVVERTMGAVVAHGDAAEIHEPRATADGLAALRLVRARAGEWHVDPRRVGMIGFSAGAQVLLESALAADAAARPAFAGYIYGRMTAVAVPTGAPPLFAALALDDPLFGRQGFGIVEAWHAANRPVELHAYEHGDHGFGIGRPGTTSTGVMPQFRSWLDAEGLLRPSAR